MTLRDACKPENFAWESELADAYHFTNENGFIRTVLHYQIPLPENKQVFFMTKYGLRGSDLRQFYQNLVRCLQQEVAVSKYLTRARVSSVLSFSAMEQARDEAGTSHIYLETEQIWPVIGKVLVNPTPYITVMDVIYRLSIVLRDISKDSVGVVHRGLDLNEVYINNEDRIKVGGFFYSYCPDVYGWPDYLPNRPSNLPMGFLNGEKGHQGLDIMTLALIAWNLFSGNPHDAKLVDGRWVFPAYANQELVDALFLGMSGNEENCQSFRRRWQDCRKQMSKTEFASMTLPIRKQLLKEVSVEYVVIPEEPG